MERYPVPSSPPRYVEQPKKVDGRRGVPVFELVAAVFIVVALAFALWLGYLLLTRSVGHPGWGAVNLALFWLVLTYLALPRLHQVFTFLYVPDYFIGRTRTADGLLGDPVNLALDGSEDDLHAAMRRAGWTLADPITLRSALGIVTSALLRRPYPAAPVSDLLLFGRPQDFAYQQEVDGNASRRHHVRFWRAPEGWCLPGGEHVDWVAGATYDRAVGLSLFTLQVTHRIDADIDIERDYLVNSLRYADPTCGVRVIKDFSTAYHCRNGGGDAIRTDGDLPIVDAVGAASRADAGTPPPGLGAAAGGSHRRAATDHAVAPRGLLFTGVLIALLILGAVDDTLTSGPDAANLIGTAVMTTAWLLTLRRQRWAWVVLMLGSTALTLALLSTAASAPVADELDLLNASFAVLVVLAVSGEAVRSWVAKGREPVLDRDTGRISAS